MRDVVHSLGVEAGTVPSEGGTQAAEIKVMAYHVYEFHSSSVLGEAILHSGLDFLGCSSDVGR